MGYQRFQPAISPGFLKGPYGAAWAAAFGLTKDYLADVTKQGIQQRFAALAQTGALAAIGAERGIPQGVAETDAGYVQSLINAWSEWELAASPWGILGVLNLMGYPDAYVVGQNGNVFGPSGSVVIPNPDLGIAGVPPSVQVGSKWTFGLPSTAFGSQGNGFVPQGFSDPWVGFWEPDTDVGNLVSIQPNPPNGFLYVNISGIDSTTGSTPPAWPSLGGTVADGTCSWYCTRTVDAKPIGQAQGTVGTNFWAAYLIVMDPAPASWTDIFNPPTPTSDPSQYELQAIFTLITAFNAGYATCCGLLANPGSITRATFGWPINRTNYGDSGMSAASASSDGLTKYWIPHHNFVTGAQAIPTPANATGYWYRATVGGTSAYFPEPTWPVIIGHTVSDGGITWTCEGVANTYLSGTGAPTGYAPTFQFIPQQT